MLNTTLSRFRFVALLEGISCVFLFFVAMPVRRFTGNHTIVKYTGWVHGLLFIAFMIMLVVVYLDLKWSFKKLFLAFIASIVPFGTFVFDAKVLKNEEAKN